MVRAEQTPRPARKGGENAVNMKEYMDWWRETSEAYIEAVEEKHQQEKRAEKKHTIRKWIADNAVALVALAVALLK